jgi:hypothetical protein
MLIERYTEIERANRILLEKMANIMQKKRLDRSGAASMDLVNTGLKGSGNSSKNLLSKSPSGLFKTPRN